MDCLKLEDYEIEKECTYKDERYLVRDNGAVLRQSRYGKRKRILDDKWTFGRENKSNPYLQIGKIRVHRIVATAFLGPPPNPLYVVDHIDTNARNNRPENLRWLTRLENALNNPVTRKKIVYICGSIEAFLENPTELNDNEEDPNFSWMRRVSKEEAENCKLRMKIWTKNNPIQSKTLYPKGQREAFEKRVYKPLQKWEAGLEGEPGLDFASTFWCAQYMWGSDVHFPLCPKDFGSDPLDDYYQNINEGNLFAYNEENQFPELTVFQSRILKTISSIIVLCKRSDNNWTLVGIILNKKDHFIHFNLGSYIERTEAEKAFHSQWDQKSIWSKGYGPSWELK